MASDYKIHMDSHNLVIQTLYLKNITFFFFFHCTSLWRSIYCKFQNQILKLCSFSDFQAKVFLCSHFDYFFTIGFETLLRGKKKGGWWAKHLMYFAVFVEVPLSHSEINGIFFFNPRLNYGN